MEALLSSALEKYVDALVRLVHFPLDGLEDDEDRKKLAELTDEVADLWAQLLDDVAIITSFLIIAIAAGMLSTRRLQEGQESNGRNCVATHLQWEIGNHCLRATGTRERKPYTMRHTFISVGFSNGANIKWLADYCGTSIVMIEKHYGKYIRNHVDERFACVFGTQTETLSETLPAQKVGKTGTSC